jgi:hypothetical protein
MLIFGSAAFQPIGVLRWGKLLFLEFLGKRSSNKTQSMINKSIAATNGHQSPFAAGPFQ